MGSAENIFCAFSELGEKSLRAFVSFFPPFANLLCTISSNFLIVLHKKIDYYTRI